MTTSATHASWSSCRRQQPWQTQCVPVLILIASNLTPRLFAPYPACNILFGNDKMPHEVEGWSPLMYVITRAQWGGLYKISVVSCFDISIHHTLISVNESAQSDSRKQLVLMIFGGATCKRSAKSHSGSWLLLSHIYDFRRHRRRSFPMQSSSAAASRRSKTNVRLT